MTTTNTKEHNIPYIIETSSSIATPQHIILKDNKIELNDCNFKNKNFLHLLKNLTSLSNYNLQQLLRNTTKEELYFLGEKVRLRKTSHKAMPDSVSITGESILESKKRGKSYLKVKDLTSEEILYSFELDYYIITPETFKILYKKYFEPESIMYYNERLPESRLIQTKSEHQFTISIDPFTPNHCKSHCENYPIVPFTFVADCILKEIFNFFGTDYEVNSIEGHPSKAIPIETLLEAEVFYQKFLKDLIYLKCEIKDGTGTSYAVLMINIKSIEQKK